MPNNGVDTFLTHKRTPTLISHFVLSCFLLASSLVFHGVLQYPLLDRRVQAFKDCPEALVFYRLLHGNAIEYEVDIRLSVQCIHHTLHYLPQRVLHISRVGSHDCVYFRICTNCNHKNQFSSSSAENFYKADFVDKTNL